MKLSLNWLESYFVTKPDWDKVWDKLTLSGIEIEGIDLVAPEFSGVVVAKVVDCKPHPDADKLKICRVDAGTGELAQIVCGAPNVTVGVLVPCAKVGAILPGGMEIAERKMRGVTSFGMLCSGDEIGVPDDADGLLLLPEDAPIGMSIRQYLDLDDQIVEFKITPNRGDCLSIRGLIREISALTEYKVVTPVASGIDTHTDNTIEVLVKDKEACPNYLTLAIKGVNNQVKLPDVMLKRLTRSGIRSISPIVDITNLVMLELGQPLHAFDLAKIGNKLQVRLAENGESLKLLDGKTVKLTPNTLLICDAGDKPAAIAGVMGGNDSGVSANTQDIVLECAFFMPNTIAGIAKQYVLNSDSATRFERGVDSAIQHMAINHAASLITQFCGGSVGAINQVQSDTRPLSTVITLEYATINRLIGMGIEHETVDNLLIKLGFQVDSQHEKLIVTVPSYRFDIANEEDIIEEVARSYGYDNIEAIMPIAQFIIEDVDNQQNKINQLKQTLVNLGFNEIVSYAFLEEKYEEMLGNPAINAVKLQNPIANLLVMRTSLIADLVKSLKHNLNYGHKQIKLFELARVFYADDSQSQPLKLSGLIYGNRNQPNALDKPIANDFYDLKHVVEALLCGCGEIKFVSCHDYSVLHSGQCAKIYAFDKLIGIIGQLHPKICQELSMVNSPYLFELDVAAITANARDFKIKNVNKQPKVERDLAFVVSDNVAVGSIVSTINASKPSNLVSLNVFDVYKMPSADSSDTNVGKDKNTLKSVAINFTFQADKTLTDEEIKHSVDTVIELVKSKFNAQLRT